MMVMTAVMRHPPGHRQFETYYLLSFSQHFELHAIMCVLEIKTVRLRKVKHCSKKTNTSGGPGSNPHLSNRGRSITLSPGVRVNRRTRGPIQPANRQHSARAPVLPVTEGLFRGTSTFQLATGPVRPGPSDLLDLVNPKCTQVCSPLLSPRILKFPLDIS